MENIAHRSDGNGGVDGLQSAAQREQLIKFLLSIDGATVPINPAAPGALKTISAASYAGTAVAPSWWARSSQTPRRHFHRRWAGRR